MISFSGQIKGELCKTPFSDAASAVAEAYGVLLYCNIFTDLEIRVTTGNADFARRLPPLFQRAFSLSFDRLPETAATRGKNTFAITEPEKLSAVLSALGFDSSGLVSLHINLGLLEEENARRAFIRGAFLASGSVSDPGKSYHLELSTDHPSVHREMLALLTGADLEPKSCARGGNYITYFKQSGGIEDFLTLTGAPLSAMELMSRKIEKDLRNGVNRRVNCDTANLDKSVGAAVAQVEAIRALREGPGFEELPEKLRETAALRADHPELSLSELSLLFNPSISKSCLNHRLRKLVEIAGARRSPSL
jgi:DNA-binding protein WhiA